MRRPVAPSCTSNRARTGDATPCRDEACWLVREVIALLRYGLRRARTSGIGVVSLHLCIGYPTLVRCTRYNRITRYLRLRGCHMCAMNRYQDTQNRAANQNIGQTTKRDGSFAGRKAKIGKKIQQKSGHGGSPGSKKKFIAFLDRSRRADHSCEKRFEKFVFPDFWARKKEKDPIGELHQYGIQ